MRRFRMNFGTLWTLLWFSLWTYIVTLLVVNNHTFLLDIFSDHISQQVVVFTTRDFKLFVECVVGHYGRDCNSHCGHCNRTAPGCQQSNGYCLHGCENNHWSGPKCDSMFVLNLCEKRNSKMFKIMTKIWKIYSGYSVWVLQNKYDDVKVIFTLYIRKYSD